MSPDRRQHRGAHPEDRRLFDAARLPGLRAATSELSWLLGKGYAAKAALKLVGDRHGLNERQRLAVARAACSDEQLEGRRERRLPVEEIKGRHLIVDGFNLMITAEAALGRGVVLLCRDGCLRDLSGVHGSYRAVRETGRAIELIGGALAALGPAKVRWLLDSPVSNSGRLAARIRDFATARGWAWNVDTVFNPDAEIVRSPAVAVTSDSTILDAVGTWVNFNSHLVRNYVPGAWIVNLEEEENKHERTG